MEYLKDLIERLGKALRITTPSAAGRVGIDEQPRADRGPVVTRDEPATTR